MASGPNDFRDPKVTKTSGGSNSSVGKWIAIIAGVLLLLLILGWILGLFADDDVETTAVPADAIEPTAQVDDAVVIEGDATVVAE